MNSEPRVLLVDDDRELLDLLADYLAGMGLAVKTCHEGAAALSVAEADYDLMVLDVMMPGLSGLDVLKRLRERSNVPVLMLTARGDDVDRIVGLELGADDYLPKPCNPRELLARIRAVWRRSGAEADGDVLVNGDLVVRPAARSVTVAGRDPELTSTEYSLLTLLMRGQGSVVSKASISEAVLGRPLGRFDRTIDVHVSNLRKKLSGAGARDDFIVTVRGSGYQVTAA